MKTKHLEDDEDVKGPSAPMTMMSFLTVFTDMLNVVKIHEELEREIADRLAAADPERFIGAMFQDRLFSLKVYRSLADNFPSAVGTLEECCRESPVLRAFLAKCLSNPAMNGLDFSGVVSTALDRPQAYARMLAKIGGTIDSGHPDRAALAAAADALERVAKYIAKQRRLAIASHYADQARATIRGKLPDPLPFGVDLGRLVSSPS